jgi:hypothetical protein
MRIRDPGWRQFGSGIQDGKNSDPASGIIIPDPQHCYNEWSLQFWGSVTFWCRSGSADLYLGSGSNSGSESFLQ